MRRALIQINQCVLKPLVTEVSRQQRQPCDNLQKIAQCVVQANFRVFSGRWR